MNGTVFDIKEFALNDGPGIRVTVFMKGCPLRCLWCHNPEGMEGAPQLNHKTGRMTGMEYTPEQLAEKIRRHADVFEMSGGGVTFSGGEPSLQAEFLCATASLLPDVHKVLDTCGYCPEDVFLQLLEVFDLFYFDLKLIDESRHVECTGVSNDLILKNLGSLDASGKPYHIRIPLIPGITDTQENLQAILQVLLGLKNRPLRVDPLPYNILAGGKYEAYKMQYPLAGAPDQNNQTSIEYFYRQLEQHNFNTLPRQ